MLRYRLGGYMKKFFCLLTAGAGLILQSPGSSAQSAGVNMKWFPGHYILSSMSSSATNQLLQDFSSIPAMRGIEKSYYWSTLETAKDVYDFSAIRADLNLVASKNKKLAIMIGYKYRISATQSSLPKYILNLPKATVGSLTQVPPYFVQGYAGDGSFNVGDQANFGHPETLARFAKLLNELAKEFDNNPNFAFVQFIETANGAKPAEAQLNNFFMGNMLMNQAAADAFQKTPLIQSLNSPRKLLPAFINNLTTQRMGFGGPDTFIDAFSYPNVGLGYVGTYPGIYHYNESNYNAGASRNILPIGMQVHHENFLYNTYELRQAGIGNGLTAPQAVNAIFNFATDRLHPNFLIWQVWGTNDEYRTALKSKLANINATNPSPVGGLEGNCPNNYISCAGIISPPVDAISPTSVITSPSSGNIVNNTINVAVNATDNVGVTRVELYANGVLQSSDPDAPYSLVYTPPAINADVPLVARAYDAAGNVKDSASVVILVRNGGDVIDPTINITNPNDGQIIPAGQYSLNISASANDNVGVVSMKLFINNNLKKSTSNGSLSFTWAVRNVTAGYYNIKIEAKDANNNKKIKIIKIRVRQ